MDEFQTTIEEIPELFKPISILNLVNIQNKLIIILNIMTYQPPTRTKLYTRLATKDTKIISCYVDSAGQVARITTFMKILVPAIWLKSKIDLVLK
jgi:hypothetical protein